MIGVFPNRNQPAALRLAEAVVDAAKRLGKDARCVEEDAPDFAGCDLVISIGGDGTVLAAAQRLVAQRLAAERLAAERLAGPGVPLWAIHTGGLGFLTDCLPEEVLDRLPDVLAGRAEVRTLGTLAISLDGAAERFAINDCVVSAGGGRMVRLGVSIDGAPLFDLHADGLIVATAAGSTAYNLAAGGPILASPTSAMVVTPICPHALAQRPVVVTRTARIEVEVRPSRSAPRLFLDGRDVAGALSPGARVRIRRGEKEVRLVRTRKRSDFEILRDKLGWGDPRER